MIIFLRALLRFALFHLLAGFFPSSDARGHMLHVLVSELGRGLGSGLICLALGIATVSDNRRVLILGQRGLETIFDGGPVERARHVPLVVGLGAIDIDNHGFLGLTEPSDF